jgi:hypothetical protein
MYIRKIAAAAGFACGAALAFAPFASADASSDAASMADSLIGAFSPAAATPIDLDISFDGYTLYDGMGTADATTLSGQFGLAIAYGDHATAFAGGGTGDYALASGTNALAYAGSTTTGATGFNYNIAEDIGNNTLGGGGAHDGAYAGGGSLIGNTDATDAAGHVVTSSNNAAYDFGNNGLTTGELPTGGNSGAFAGDSGLIGYNNVAGNGDTAYTAGNLNGFGDGSAAVAGNNNFASSSGNETGMNEGAFSGFGNNNTAIADTNYTTSGDGVSATFGNGNYAYVYGPDNSTADASGSDSNIAYVTDPYGMSGPADSATAGGAGGGHDIAEVLYTHGDASATGTPNLYDILTPFGESATPAAADGAAASPAAAFDITPTLTSEVNALNSLFTLDTTLAAVPSTDVTPGADGFLVINPADAADDNSIFNTLVFGLNPDNVSPDPGAYDVFNGALTEFANAYNVGLVSLLDPTNMFDPADIFGTHAEFLAGGSAAAIGEFLNLGFQDLLGYFDPSNLLGAL